MGRRIKVSLSMDEDVVRRAKEIGLNLSRVCERALIRAIRALEQAEGRITIDSKVSDVDGGPGRIRTCDPRHVKAMSYP